MISKIPNKNLVEEICIPKYQYEEIKNDFLYSKDTKPSLYRKYNAKYNIDRKVFIEILDLIRKDNGLPNPINKKMKRIHNQFSFYDKHPNDYEIKGIYTTRLKSHSKHKNRMRKSKGYTVSISN